MHHRYILPAFVLLLHSLFPHSAVSADPKNETAVADDLPRSQPLEPERALNSFRLARGFQLELVAAEPLVSDPVDACFDADGRMYVAEMHGYPFSQEPTQLNPNGGGKPDAGIIRLLEDRDGDGRFERSVVFADKISWPTSVCCYDGGVFVLAPSHIYYFKDTDGDDRADVRRVVYSGFSRSNVQALANNLKWGLDHQIYLAGGRNGAELTYQGKKIVAQRNQDIRFNPRTEALELVSGGQQFGHSFDDWGNRFVCSNSNHILHVVHPNRYLKRNPFLAASGVVRSIAKEGGASQVFRTSPPEPWRILRQIRRAEAAGYKLVQSPDGSWEFVPLGPKPPKPPPEYPIGYFTSATGVTIYRGDAYPAEFRGNAFIGDVGGNLVHRKIIQPRGASFLAERADAGTEILTSTDGWFRPVNFVNAPDGTLFVLDMYRETIEHPHSIPEDIKAHLDLESGDERGRIYRLVSPGMQRRAPVKLERAPIAEVAAALDSDNGWQRMTAHRLIWERQDASARKPLESLFRTSQRPVARMHALWSLSGLKELSDDLLTAALSDPDPRVREHAVRLAENRAAESPPLLTALLSRIDDENIRVRMQLAYSLGEVDHPEAVRGLSQLAGRLGDDADVRIAWLSSAANNTVQLAQELLHNARDGVVSSAVLVELARMIGTQNDTGAARNFLASISGENTPMELRPLLLNALGEGLARRGATVKELLGEATAPDLQDRVAEMFADATAVALSPEHDLRKRIGAVRLLAFGDYGSSTPALRQLLTPQTSPELQTAAVEALNEHRDAGVATVLLGGWRGYSPSVRNAVVDALLTDYGRIEQLLQAVQSGKVQSAEISSDKRQLLLNHPQGRVSAAARKIFGDDATSNRAEVVAEYESALELPADIDRGRLLFSEKCTICHKLDDRGHQVGPEIKSVGNKSPRDLLIAILDPNREAQPNFNVYTVVTKSGRILNGIIAAETATSLVLRRAEGKEDTVLRNQIDELASSGKSLMPEGLEKDFSRQQLADLIAFVKSIKAGDSPPSE